MCENSSRRTPRPQNLIFLVFFSTKGEDWSLGPSDKIKNVWTVILKVLTCVRIHSEELFFHIFDFTGKYLGQGVLRDEFLHMWELSGWQSKRFLILSYGLKPHSWLPALEKQENQIYGTRSSSGWVLTHLRTFNFSFSTSFNLIMWSANVFQLP